MSMDTSQLPLPKNPTGTRKQQQARAARAEAKVKKAVRAACVKRDGMCRIASIEGPALYDTMHEPFYNECGGVSQWAHMHARRRSQTRGEAPEKRHTTAASLMLCLAHHDQYDGRARPRLLITRTSRKGADGPLRFRRGTA
jgi:hypothetical protein